MSSRTYPSDAKCAVEWCEHPFGAHSIASNCDVCNLCDNGLTFDPKAWHDFMPTKLAGGAVTPEQEREAYEKAMREA